MSEEFFKVWSKHILGNKEDLKIGLAQLEAEIRAEERKKVLEYITSNYMVCTSDGSCADYVDLIEETEHRLKEQKNE